MVSIWLTIIALLAAATIALSAIIISKQPRAKELIDKLTPFQGFLGVGLLVLGIIDLIKVLPHLDLIGKLPYLMSLAIYGSVASEVFLGFLLGMPLIAKWIPGDSPAEQKALEMQQKIIPFQAILGGLAVVTALLLAYYEIKY
ncbi:MAG: hypothetical protein KBG48_00780 [Kofleriaceae bacterium]|jgi:hypothetical protein|nr:hypothetical protein [Kofleriaceae bacterium]MBP9165878.1 hypothetical protein [Kofleriaceae bacterium]MBP9862481.1 hypothetical protein [Kofleriaceae bacterium]